MNLIDSGDLQDLINVFRRFFEDRPETIFREEEEASKKANSELFKWDRLRISKDSLAALSELSFLKNLKKD